MSGAAATGGEDDPVERARRLFAGPVGFLMSAPDLGVLPPPLLPEVAFAGRSNVGKSSLLNALTGRAGLARTSNTPGRTQALNLFEVGEPPLFRLVDMPGYGFAEAPRDVVRAWSRLVSDYLRGRPTLRRVMLLVDARRGVMPPDLATMAMLDQSAVSYQLVLTKCDKLKPSAVEAVRARSLATLRSHVAAHPELVVTSAEKRQGVEDLRAAVLASVS